MDVLTASVPVAAYRATAMTAEEIDAHPDAARIWATIKLAKDDMDRAIQEADERADVRYQEGFFDGEREGCDNARSIISDTRSAMAERDRCPAWVLDMMDDLRGEI